MTKVTEAIYENGVLRPVQALELEDQQRVRLIIQSLDATPPVDRADAMSRFRAGVTDMNFRLNGAPPTRDQLHDRV